MVKYGIRVREIMTRKPITINKETNIRTAAKIMREKHIGGLMVIDKGKLSGMITEGDILVRAFLKNKNPRKTKVWEVMTRNVITVNPDTDLYHVTQLMNKKDLKRLPVVEGDRVVGYLTERDLLKIEPSLLDVLIEKLRIKEPTVKIAYTLRR